MYERIGMHLPLEKIARNLNVSTSTANRINAMFQRTGSVDPVGPQKRRLDLRRLDERSELFVVGLVLDSPSLYFVKERFSACPSLLLQPLSCTREQDRFRFQVHRGGPNMFSSINCMHDMCHSRDTTIEYEYN